MPEMLGALSRALSRAFLWFAGFGLVVMTGIIGWQVFARYVLQSSPAWAEQASLVLMLWYIGLAAAAGVREGFHIRMTAVEDAVPAGARHVMRLAAHAIVGALGVAMAVWGGELVMRTWSHAIPTLPLPRGVAYLPLPLSGALILLFAVEHILAELTGRKVQPLWN